MIRTALRWGALVAIPVGIACGSSSSSSQSAGPASCTVTLSGAVTGTYQCRATVGFYQGQMGVAIVTNDNAADQLTFAAVTGTTDTLHTGTYGAGDVVEEASSLSANVSDGGTNDFSSAAQHGSAAQGSFSLTIDSVGPETDGLYEGTKGSVDETLASIGSAASVTAHIDFVSVGIGSNYGSNDADSGTGTYTYDAGPPPYVDAAPTYPTVCRADAMEAYTTHVEVFPCTASVTQSGGTSTITVTGTGSVYGEALNFSVSVPGAFQVMTYTESNTSESGTIADADGGVIAQITQSNGSGGQQAKLNVQTLATSTDDGGTNGMHVTFDGNLLTTDFHVTAPYQELRFSF